MFENEHPARRAALLSREYVRNHDREGWLGLFAEDAIIEDPIGVSVIDPAGKGHRGTAAREAFWDNFIAPATIDGKVLVQRVTGIFTYHVDAAGKLLSLRGYWETDDPANSLTEVERA